MTQREGKSRTGEDVASLLEHYIRQASLYGHALSEGNSKQANKCHAELAKLHRKLRAQGEAAQGELLGLLEHPEPAVRIWAATHVLEFAPERGEPVLARIAQEEAAPLSLSAEFTLERWREGALSWD
jgi:hypothetical protein